MQTTGPQEKNTAESDAIIIKDVSKRFKIPNERKRTVYDNILGIVKGRTYGYDEFWAVKDVSFTIKRGETIGIIGENGSGKSTLLKIIAGVLYPDTGKVTVNGKIAPFLELGVGFNPELTATENIFIYSSIMGMSKKQIKNKIEDIFEFAELEKFRNVKLKNFSSGMYARLAFSTAISTNPDILLIDEALSVGDAAFQQKCSEKINEFRAEKKTIVLVSHSLGTVGDLCKRTVLINKGRITSIGYSEKVISDYHNSIIDKEEKKLKKQHDTALEQQAAQDIAQVLQNSAPQTTADEVIQDTMGSGRWGSREIEITNVTFHNNCGEEKHVFKTGEPFIARIKYSAKTNIEQPVFGIAIHRSDGVHVTGPNTKFHKCLIDNVNGEGIVEYIVDSLPLLEGSYLFTAAIYDFECAKPYDHHEKRFKFRVINDVIKDYGLTYIPCRWKYE